MTDETIVAMFDTAAHADAAVRDLQAAKVPAGAISREPSTAGATTTATAAAPREQGFWASLFGGEPDHGTGVYDQGVASGSHVVSVRVPGDHASAVIAVLERNNPIDIDERAASYGMTQTATTSATMPAAASTTTTRQTTAAAMPAATARTTDEGGTIQLAEERLVVGKRLVNSGGARIRRYVVETPVEQQVTLHDEKVVVERHPVTGSRPVTNADFTDKTIEMTETAEVPVVGKEARVVEEISLRKEATKRVETVRDTVRKEEVEVEQIPAATTTTTTSGTTAKPRTSKT